MNQFQLELFEDAANHKACQLCQKPLSKQKHANRRTKLFGLCFSCLQDFEQSDAMNVETFLKSANRCAQRAKRDRHRERRRHRRESWLRQEQLEILERIGLKGILR
jgi:hypothetical protein